LKDQRNDFEDVCLARLAQVLPEGVAVMILADRGSGSASYHPRMLLGILVYGYATGVFSSRKLERATYDSVAFRFIAANNHPDHDTIAAFRRRFLKEIEGLFVQVLLLARERDRLDLAQYRPASVNSGYYREGKAPIDACWMYGVPISLAWVHGSLGVGSWHCQKPFGPALSGATTAPPPDVGKYWFPVPVRRVAN
jgi:hypothetical protein